MMLNGQSFLFNEIIFNENVVNFVMIMMIDGDTVKSAHVPGPEPRAILQRLIALLRVPLQMPLHSAHFR